MQQELQFVASTLVHALENYLDRSFQMQKDAREALTFLRQEQADHDAKFGGYIAFDASVIERYETLVGLSKSSDRGMIEQVATAWKDIQVDLPESRTFAALDARLSEKHDGLWSNIKQPLQKVQASRSCHESAAECEPGST
jgi:hypothetical protein